MRILANRCNSSTIVPPGVEWGVLTQLMSSVPLESNEVVRSRLGKYEILRRLTTGGMAEILLARAPGIERFEKDVVVKQIRPHLLGQPEMVQLFLDEARLTA